MAALEKMFKVDLSVEERGRKRPEYTVDTDLKGELTLIDLLEWTKSTLIITADQVLKEEQRSGFDKNPVLVVDNRPGKQVINVSPLGQIEFIARQQMTDILIETYKSLLHRSKVLTGRYKSSHFVFLNGEQVATDESSLKSWLKTAEISDKDIIRIVNVQPYARKLERYGVTAQRSKSRYEDPGRRKKKGPGRLVLSPNGTYYLTARAIKAKYKRNASIRFTFLPGSTLGLKASFKNGRRGKNSAGRSYLYPTIVIGVQGRGIL